jgi:hypothetical protein
MHCLDRRTLQILTLAHPASHQSFQQKPAVLPQQENIIISPKTSAVIFTQDVPAKHITIMQYQYFPCN